MDGVPAFGRFVTAFSGGRIQSGGYKKKPSSERGLHGWEYLESYPEAYLCPPGFGAGIIGSCSAELEKE